MTNISFSEATPVLSELKERMKKFKPAPVFFYPYISRVLNERFEKLHPEYPMTIQIPKANKYLLKGDYTPAATIVVQEPITRGDGTPIWFAQSWNEVFLRFGYTNEDARFICEQKMDMEFIHGFMGGSTGHGKSVTINAMLAGIFYEYPPWEVEVHMSDAKIVEFKKYGVGHRIPHIATIAATEDAAYVESVLARLDKEMNERAKIFGSLGVSNLKGFRQKTGLCLPRVMLIMDEVESTFKMAGKRATKIAGYIDSIARLGRSSGYHIYMATQNMSSDIPKSAINQVRIRACLGASPTVSEAILGNSGAADNMGRIGKLIVNTDVLNGGNTFPGNVQYQTPFLTDDNFEEEMEELETKGAEVGFKRTMSFYDENDIKTLVTFAPIVEAAIARMNKDGELAGGKSVVPIGYPAFVTDDVDGLLKIRFDQRDVENVMLCTTDNDCLRALLGVLSMGFRGKWQMLHFTTDLENGEYTQGCLNLQEVREASVPPLSTIDGLVRKRLFLLYVDNLAKNEGAVTYDREEIEKLFEQENIPREAWGNGLMCRRALVYSFVQQKPEHATMWKSASGLVPTFAAYYKECVRYNATIEPITLDKLSKVVYFLGDLSKVIGWGRDPSSKMITLLKKMLQDCNRAAVLCICYTRSMEGITDLVSGIRYTFFDKPDTRDWGRMRTEAPTQALSDKLVVLYDSADSTDPQKKFKRTLVRDE